MQSKGNAPTAAQKRWREAVRELGSVISGGPAVIHHCVGATAKHNKVAIGHEWIIPLTDDEHKDLHAGETYGYESRKDFEKWMIIAVSDNLRDHKDKPSQSVMDAIKDYHL
tara:strand:+ start:64 stop:396 length:333 start_codon:yes stop_codon:yes gene_type:complete